MPFAMAFAAPSWSEASAASTWDCQQALRVVSTREILTDHNVRLRRFSLKDCIVVQASDNSLHAWESLLDRLGFFISSGEANKIPVGVLLVNGE